jgi:hypothetical protein
MASNDGGKTPNIQSASQPHAPPEVLAAAEALDERNAPRSLSTAWFVNEVTANYRRFLGSQDQLALDYELALLKKQFAEERAAKEKAVEMLKQQNKLEEALAKARENEIELRKKLDEIEKKGLLKHIVDRIEFKAGESSPTPASFRNDLSNWAASERKISEPRSGI